MRHRLKAADAPLVHEREQERLDRVVKVMAERELRDAALAERCTQRAAAHLRAQGAGIILLAHVEHDLFDVRFQAGVWHAERIAQLRHRREVHAVKAELDRDRLERERLRIVPAQLIERHEQHERILAARDADGDGVARRDHVIILHAPAHQTGERIQVVHKQPPK